MQIRTAEERDAVALAHVLVTTFRVAHRDQLPPDYPYLTPEQSAHNWARALRTLRDRRGRPEHVFAAEDDDGTVVGVAMAGPLRDEDADETIADLHVLYVLTERQGRGIGRRLVATAARWALERGYRAMQVRVLAVNAPARRFYEATGARLIGEETRIEGSLALVMAVYEWADLAALAAGEGAGGG
jgi:GNAT superfamily N-acetyltransferase